MGGVSYIVSLSPSLPPPYFQPSQAAPAHKQGKERKEKKKEIIKTK